LARALRPHHRFLVEKSPRHGHHIPFINELFPTARFVHVVRDGRDVAVSVRAASRSWAPDWRGDVARSVWTSAADWRNSLAAVRAATPAVADRLLEVRYEDAIADPYAVYRRLYEFAGIPYGDALLERVFDATDFERNFRPDEGQFRRAGRVGDWRTRFTTRDRIEFARAAGTTLVDLGYEDHPFRWVLPSARLRPGGRLRPVGPGPDSATPRA
jgi:hypothetical protein